MGVTAVEGKRPKKKPVPSVEKLLKTAPVKKDLVKLVLKAGSCQSCHGKGVTGPSRHHVCGSYGNCKDYYSYSLCSNCGGHGVIPEVLKSFGLKPEIYGRKL